MPRFVAEGNVLDLVVSGSPVSSGELVQIAGLAGIIVADAEVGQSVGVAVRGLIAVPKASGTTFSAGDTVEYDEGDGLAVASGDYQVGIAAYDAGSGPTEVMVLLNAQDGDDDDDDDDEGDDDDDEGDEGDDDEGDDEGDMTD